MTTSPRWPPSPKAEQAKRRLIAGLHEFGAAGCRARPGSRLRTRIRPAVQHQPPVVTGHDDGIITVDLAEGDGVHPEQMRVTMD